MRPRQQQQQLDSDDKEIGVYCLRSGCVHGCKGGGGLLARLTSFSSPHSQTHMHTNKNEYKYKRPLH